MRLEEYFPSAIEAVAKAVHAVKTRIHLNIVCLSPSGLFSIALFSGRLKSWRAFGGNTRARSKAIPIRPSVPSSKSFPIKVTPCGTRRGAENFGKGLADQAQSLRASETCTKPARSVKDGCPVKFPIVRASSRRDGTRVRPLRRRSAPFPGRRCVEGGRPVRSPRRKRKRACQG